MDQAVPFRLQLTGGDADRHQFQGYDGYMSLAGFALTFALVANYAETGEIRHRGNFDGRKLVLASAPIAGSVVADFKAWLTRNPAKTLGLTEDGANRGTFLRDLTDHVIARNIGDRKTPNDPLLQELIKKRGGDVEALVARTEAPIRQAHDIIGRGGVEEIKILSGYNALNVFNPTTKAYVDSSIHDEALETKHVSVNAFSANHGSGGLWDDNLQRSMPFSMSKEVLNRVRRTFSWALDQYANRTGGTIEVTYSRMLAMDGTPKKYIIHGARR